MTSSAEIDRLKAEAAYQRDRVALMRAKLYRSGIGSDHRLQALERALRLAEQRLREARASESPPSGSTPGPPIGEQTSTTGTDASGKGMAAVDSVSAHHGGG